LDIELLSQQFKNFAIRECKGSSWLYEFLSLKISEDNEILELSSHCATGQPVPNMFLAAVHYLLLSGSNHELKEYYPSITQFPRPVEESFFSFKHFCEQKRDNIRSILSSKLVQTNEIRRCTYLYPSFCFVYDTVKKPLSLIEIGTSAGLQLLWDKYSYSYGDNEVYGDPHSSVHLTAELRKGHIPLWIQNSPPVASKIGIDLHVVDLSNNEDHLWLKSLIWPDHKERLELFEKATELFHIHPVNLIEGEAVSLLLDLVEQIPVDSILCIFHTHVANQMPVKNKLMENIRTIGAHRDVFHLYNNVRDTGKLHMDYFINGEELNKVIGETDGHGRWFTWEVNA